MKITTQKTIRSLYGLCLVIIVFACQYQDAGPLIPNRYGALRSLKLPDMQISAPSSISITPSTITPSTLATSVNAGIVAIPTISQMPSSVLNAVTDMNTALTAAGIGATELVASFTPQVIATLTSQGTMPSDLQATVMGIGSNARVKPYLTTFTFPKVNGQEIASASSTINLPPLVTPISQAESAVSVISAVGEKPPYYVGNDVIFKAANDVFILTIHDLEADRLRNVADVNAVYAPLKTAIESELPTCQTTNSSKYNSLIASALQSLNTNIGNLNAAKTRLGDSAYNLLAALTYTQYTYQLQAYYQLRAADINECKVINDTRLRYAIIARDTDINTINNTFNLTVNKAREILFDLYSESSDNQGSGQ